MIFKTTPIAMIKTEPYFLMRYPEKNPGANIPITCHCKTVAVSANMNPQTSIASGVPAMIKFIIP